MEAHEKDRRKMSCIVYACAKCTGAVGFTLRPLCHLESWPECSSALSRSEKCLLLRIELQFLGRAGLSNIQPEICRRPYINTVKICGRSWPVPEGQGLDCCQRKGQYEDRRMALGSAGFRGGGPSSETNHSDMKTFMIRKPIPGIEHL
jgi:hypothetical protein